jgi:aminoglycoside phosphotransferase (APT) family kinase protein
VEDRGHPDRLGAFAVLAQIVDEDRLARLDREPLAGERVDLRLRLVQADLAGDHLGVEEVHRRALVDPETPRVRDQPGAHTRRTRIANRGDHRLLRTQVGEHARDQTGVVGDADERAEPPLELLVGELASLQTAEYAERLGVPAKQRQHGVLLEPLALAEAPERLPDVRRQDTAEVDYQCTRHMLPRVDGIDQAGIERWFAENVTGAESPLTFERVSGGRSNITYSVTDAAGNRWALRRPPLGKRLASAHDMAREHRIISALGATDVPVPPAVGLCEDDAVNGDPFYVMGWVEGPILRSRKEGDLFPAEDERRAIGERVVETLVAIHSVDPDAVGLGELAKKEDYVARQLHRWHGQWDKQHTRELPLIDDVHDRLAARIPDQGSATIVHGDYRLDNMILSPSGEVAAVVDWELCTLGDPLADVGLLLVYWGEEGDDLIPLMEPATMLPGFPSRDEVRERYSELSGRDLSEIDFYVALGLWKLAIVLEGVFARYSAGQYGDEDDGGREFARIVERLVEEADKAERRLG